MEQIHDFYIFQRALKSITIREIPLGKSVPERPPIRMTIIELPTGLGETRTNVNDSQTHRKTDRKCNNKVTEEGDKKPTSPESLKLITDAVATEKGDSVHEMVPPMNSVQFMAEWKYLKGSSGARSDYLSVSDEILFLLQHTRILHIIKIL